MKIKKIVIQSKNKKHITDIAMLVDRLDFLLDIKQIREKWKIDKLYYFYQMDEFINFHIADNKGKISDPKETQKRLEKFNQEIITLRNKYRRTKNFDIVIKYAIGFGAIPDGIYDSCYWDKVLL